MLTRVVLPKWGMGIEEGTVVSWLCAVGDLVTVGQPLLEVETAKATQEIEAPVSGRLVAILIAEGDTAPVNSPRAEIEHDD